MFAQIGNIVFSLPLGFDTYSKTDETTYAQHNTISNKPVLQPMANELEQISIDISLHAEFCNVVQSISALKNSKDTFEILPFLFGDGRYIGDYVIKSIQENYIDTFEDGTPIRASLNLSLLEYQVADKLAQQQNAARKNAFAVGDKKPVLTGLAQPPTVPQDASVNVAAINSESSNINDAVSQYEDNASQQTYLQDQIKASLVNVNTQLESFNEKLNTVVGYIDDVNAVEIAVQNMADAANGFTFPVTGIEDLQRSNLQLQSANSQLQISVVSLNYNIITRRA